MNFVREIFKTLNTSKWNYYQTDGSISFNGREAVLEKTSASWDTLGMQLKNPRNLKSGDLFKLQFSFDTNTAGSPSDSSASFIEFALKLDNSGFTHSNYGVYVQGAKFFALNHSPQEPGVGDIEEEERYGLTIEILDDSSMSVFMRGGVFGEFYNLGNFSGPFIDRDAYFTVNIYSEDTVRLLDFKGQS